MKPTILFRQCLVFVVLLTFCAAPVAAQQGTKWWTSERYKRELGLTTEQSQRLESIFQSWLPKLKTQKQTLDVAEREFERLVERGADGEVMEQVGRVESLRAELSKSRTLMLLAMRKTLTTDQWIRMGALHQAVERETSAQRQTAP